MCQKIKIQSQGPMGNNHKLKYGTDKILKILDKKCNDLNCKKSFKLE